MKKLILACISNTLMIVLPLAANPSLIWHFKILLLVAGSICMWLTQPAFTMQEQTAKKHSDLNWVLLILAMSLVSVVAPVIDWAYFHTNPSYIGWMSITGLVLMLSGLVFRAWAVRTLGEFFTPTVQIQDKHQLITKGPYSLVRHPSYTGAFLSFIGGAMLLESWMGLAIAFLAMNIAYYVRIKIEEQELRAHFGTRYESYQVHTKKIIPFVW